MLKLITAVILLSSTQIAFAGDDFDSPVIRTSKTQQYMVSAVLKKNTETVVINLVQAIEKAHSKEEAKGQFFTRVMAEYKDYGVVSSLVTPVKESKDGCETWL